MPNFLEIFPRFSCMIGYENLNKTAPAWKVDSRSEAQWAFKMAKNRSVKDYFCVWIHVGVFLGRERGRGSSDTKKHEIFWVKILTHSHLSVSFKHDSPGVTSKMVEWQIVSLAFPEVLNDEHSPKNTPRSVPLGSQAAPLTSPRGFEW